LQAVAEVLQLKEYLDRKPAQLSGGQRQRVAMGRAIVRDADVFLFDEPLSNLDAKLRNQMRSEIRRIHKTYKTTSIYVTHDQVEAMTLGDRVVVMKDGYIEQCGTPMDIYLNPVNMFVASFIGAPSMNMLDATLYKDYLDLEGQKLPLGKRFDTSRLPLGESGKKVKLGIRPDFLLDENFAGDSESLVKIGNCKIELMEPLGFDKELNLHIGSQAFKARLDLRTLCEEGDTINLCFDTKRVHLFDPETEKNLFPE
jgi:multiple sugar transport system ATP-binding protein